MATNIGKELIEKRSNEITLIQKTMDISRQRMLEMNYFTEEEIQESLLILRNKLEEKTKEIDVWETIDFFRE